jgi:hypothetical protein
MLMRELLRSGSRGARSLSFRVRSLAVASLLLGSGLGCCTKPLTIESIPLCPEPTDAMILELLSEQIPTATADYLGRVELMCSALQEIDDQ